MKDSLKRRVLSVYEDVRSQIAPIDPDLLYDLRDRPSISRKAQDGVTSRVSIWRVASQLPVQMNLDLFHGLLRRAAGSMEPTTRRSLVAL